MAMLKTIAQNLLQIRLRKNLSQRMVAEKAGLSVSYVSMLERGRRSPPLETLDVLALALGVTPLTLFERKPSRRLR